MNARRTEPTRSILDPRFVYVPAAHSDIRETFKRIEAERCLSMEPIEEPEDLWVREET